MERSVVTGVLALAAAGWVCGLLFARLGRDGDRRDTALAPAAAALAALALVALMTVPGRAIWAGAAGWGPGFVAGGLAALLGGWPAVSAPRRGLGSAGATAAALFAAPGAAAVVVLWLRPTLADSLVGAATGWLLVSILLALTRDAEPGAAGAGQRRGHLILAAGTGFAVTLCAAVAMGAYRDAAAGGELRWASAILATGAAVPLLALLASLPAASERRRLGAAPWAIAAAALLAGLAFLVGDRLLGQPRFVQVAGVGLTVPLLLWWLSTEGAGDPDRAGDGGVPLHLALAALVVLAGTVAAFYLLIGYGVGIMLVAAWLPAAVVVATSGERPEDADARAPGRVMLPLLTFGVVVLLYRLFLERFQGDLSGAVLTDHFAVFSLVAGAVTPPLLAGWVVPERGRDPAPARALLGLLVALVLALALPAALISLWGPRAAVGLLAGLMVGLVMSPGKIGAAAAALLVALPVLQWSPAALAVSGLPRAEKVRIVLWLGGILVAAVLATDIGARLIASIRRRGRYRAAEAGEGAHL